MPLPLFRESQRTCVILASCGCVATAQAPSSTRPGDIRGVVVETSAAPLADVEVSASGTTLRTRTAADGRFRLSRVDPGSHLIVARRSGFAPESISITLTGGDTADLRLVLR